uniref:Uncharacterized protein n=1 Tax=Sphaerodactylus townsendi TaxID=933632 RepID=A0ACB8G4S0_9SAUR
MNQAEESLAADPELEMDRGDADWCQEDQRQDEFLKERKETAELADPKAIKVVPVQCQAVPEVGGGCAAPSGVPSSAAEQRSCGASTGDEVPVPETDPESSKSRDSVVQDLSGRYQNELKAAAAQTSTRVLQQPTERTVVKAQHYSCPAEDRVEVLYTRLKRKLEGTGGGQSGIKMKGPDMHYWISVCSGGGHCKNVLYDEMTKPYHKRGKVVNKVLSLKYAC